MSSNAGTYNFNSDADNPLDTNFGWANALLGHLNTYTEGNNNTRSLPRFNQPEFFVQDNWRINRKLTLDLGVRFSHIGVVYEKDREIGWFDPNAWGPAKAVKLWQPHCANGVFPCTGANRVALNPLTGEQRASPWIGAVVSGSGDLNNGTVFGRELPDTYPDPGIRTAPRLGFGWDVFGDGKTAVRGGFGTSYNRLGDGQYGGFTGVISRTVSLQWTTIDDRFNAPSLENPLNGTMVQEETRPITVHSWSIGVQRELPWRLLADVAYVGNTVRNAFAVNAGQSYTNQLNNPDPRLVANPTPNLVDRTTGNALTTNLIRPNYPGRGDITQRVFLDELYRNYNAIQLEVRRRLAGGLAWAVNYTGSVTKQYAAYDWFRSAAENEARNSHKNGNGTAPQPEGHLQLDAAGSEPVHGQQRHCQGRLRRLAVVRDLDLPGRDLGEFRLQLLRRGAQRHDVDRGPHRLARGHRVRSESAAQRADVRAAVPHRVRAAAGPADQCGRHALSGHRGWRRAGRCPHGPRLHQPRHDPAEELQHRTRTQPAGARRGVQRVQHHAVSGREHDRDLRLRDRRADEPSLRARSAACAPIRTE